MLERKYGGVKARTAALTIQRAFRRYTLLKKFAAITAMAKAEKRLSRKLQEQEQQEQRLAYHSQVYVQQQPQQQQQQQHHHHHQVQSHLQQQQHSPVNRPTPTRSMSLRERRHGGVVHVDGSAHGCSSPMPRSHSGRCEIQITSHQVGFSCNVRFVFL